MASVVTEKIDWNGIELSIETGKIARQADGAVIVRFGGTTVLCTTVYAKDAANETDFFPLTVNYQEKFYACGRIPGGYLKREGKPADREVLLSRLIDRPIRPLFPDGFLNETQIVCTTLSFDENCDPGTAAMIGASASLSISGAPFLGPIAGCKVGYKIDSGFVLNPAERTDLDLVVAGTKEGILMVESEANELSEETMTEAVMFGFEKFQPVLEMIEKFKKKAGKPVVEIESYEQKYAEAAKNIEKAAHGKIKEALKIKDKLARREALKTAKSEVCGALESSESTAVLTTLFEKILASEMRSSLMSIKKRIDGRAPEQIRDIACEIDILPKVHGSALFTRGETQAIVVATLGSSADEQTINDIEGDRRERLMLHYNFPPYSVGETGRLGSPGRREIGHGKLACRAINPVLPRKDDFPYAIRVVSDITESNGSSSMATVCCSSLALMAAGVPLRGAVAGIAMGLVKEGAHHVILSDIMGDEDHLGDMDFKVAGTANGITALQMDIKITSITREIIVEALAQAKAGRQHILNIMNKTIAAGRSELSSSAPRIVSIAIDRARIADLIGPGGKVIKEICERTKAKIDVSDDGTVEIFSLDKNGLDEAIKSVRGACCPPEIGAEFKGKVVKIVDFGAFVSIGNGKEGLVHISNIANHRVESVEDVLSVGQEINVKVIGIDERGKIKLSCK